MPNSKKAPKGVKETVGKIVEVAKKIPMWLKRAQAEFRQLVDRLVRLDSEIERLTGLVTAKKATKYQKSTLRLLKMQRKAMAGYRTALEARIEQGAANPGEKL